MLICGLALCATPTSASDRGEPSKTTELLQSLQEQNQKLQAQLERQQALIESLTQKVSDIQASSLHNASDMRELESKLDTTGASAETHPVSSLGKVSISGEGGVGFFKT